MHPGAGAATAVVLATLISGNSPTDAREWPSAGYGAG
jgi:hypothetical protein